MTDIAETVLNILGVCMLLFFAYIFVKRFFVTPFFGGKSKENKKYDERQVQARGRAYKISFLAVIIYMFVCAALSAVEFYWAEAVVQFSLGIILASLIFLAVSVFGDAYFAGSRINPMVYPCFSSLACIEAYKFARDLLNGEKMIGKTGLTSNILPLAVAVWSALIVAVFVTKRIIDKRTADGE